MRRRKGQSILEYVIVLTVIIAAIAWAAAAALRPAVTAVMVDTSAALQGASGKLPR